MNYLLEKSIKTNGKLERELRVNHYQVRQFYSHNGKTHFFDVFKPLTEEFKTMSKLAAAKKLAQEKKQSINIQTKPALSLEGFAAVKEVKQSLDAIISRLMVIEAQLTENNAKLEKLHSITFNNNNDQIITLLKNLVDLNVKTKQVESVKPTEQKKEEETTNNNLPGNAFKQFQKYFSGNVTEENFNLAFKGCDFSTIETMETTLKAVEKKNQDNGKGFICARKSKKQFVSALWQTYIDTKGKTETAKGEKGKGNSPVFSVSTFAKNLGIEKSTIKDILEMVDGYDCFGDAEENEILDIILEENEDVDDNAYSEFIEFCKAKF